MKSLATLTNLYTGLSQQSSATNQTLGIQLMKDGERYNIQKYFDNERSFTTTTVGSASLTLTSAPNAGAISGTLSSAWAYPTGYQLVNFTGATKTSTLTGAPVVNAVSATLTAPWSFTTATINTSFSTGDIRAVTYTNGSASITWGLGLSAPATTSITTVLVSDQRNVLFSNGSTALTWSLALDSFATTAIGTVGFQAYPIPAIISKVTNDTVNVGQLKFVPAPIMTRDEWDKLNFLPYNSDIPGYFFIYQGSLLIFPVPSTTGNIITFNYKGRVPDFSTAFLFSDTNGTAYVAGSKAFDYQNGSLSGIAVGSTSITGVGTSWNTTGKFPLNTDVSFYNLYLNIQAPNGDGFWYPISQFNSDTSLTLALPINYAPASTTAAHGYAIAQMPVLQEDFHDMLLDYSLLRYYSDISKNPTAYKLHKEEYDKREILLEEYAGTKTVNINLRSRGNGDNPNKYIYAQIGINP